jgi:hypothetical protein
LFNRKLHDLKWSKWSKMKECGDLL